MTVDPAFDSTYSVNSRIVCSIKSSQSVLVVGVGTPFELPLPLFQLLMSFAEARTIQQAYQSWETDITIEDFAGVVSEFVQRGLLERQCPTTNNDDLRQLLNPRIFENSSTINKIASWMQLGRAIVICDALPLSFAEEVCGELHQSNDWITSEGGHSFFQYRNSVISPLENLSPPLARCSRVFRSAGTRRFIAELSGSDCSGDARVAAAWYRSNDHALPHDDSSAMDPRSVAYIWYLTREWQPAWGGALFWCPTGQFIVPKFNMLVMFKVMPSNMHAVCPVSHTATGRRITINGFWNQAKPRSMSVTDLSDSCISSHAYGPLPPANDELGPVIVL